MSGGLVKCSVVGNLSSSCRNRLMSKTLGRKMRIGLGLELWNIRPGTSEVGICRQYIATDKQWRGNAASRPPTPARGVVSNQSVNQSMATCMSYINHSHPSAGATAAIIAVLTILLFNTIPTHRRILTII